MWLFPVLGLSLWATWRLRRHRPFPFVLATGLQAANGYAVLVDGMASYRYSVSHEMTIVAAVLCLMGTAAALHTARRQSQMARREQKRIGDPARARLYWNIAAAVAERGLTPAEFRDLLNARSDDDLSALVADAVKPRRQRHHHTSTLPLPARYKDELVNDVFLKVALLRANPRYDWHKEIAEQTERWHFLYGVDRRIDRDVAHTGVLAAAFCAIVLAMMW